MMVPNLGGEWDRSSGNKWEVSKVQRLETEWVGLKEEMLALLKGMKLGILSVWMRVCESGDELEQ
jgi:hypothetical protein